MCDFTAVYEGKTEELFLNLRLRNHQMFQQ